MNYRKIIADAWKLTQESKAIIKWYAFVPAMLSTAIGICELVYQVMAFKKSAIFSEGHESFLYELLQFAGNFIQENTSLGISIIIILILILLFNFAIHPFTESAKIQMIARSYNGQTIILRDGIKYGMDYFLRVMGYFASVKYFSLFLIFSVVSFLVRNIGLEILRVVLIPAIIIACVIFIINVLLTYTEYFIVIDNTSVGQGIYKSVKMVIYYIEHTLLLVVLMGFIGIRVVINVLAVTIVPTIIIISTSYLGSFNLEKIGLIVGISLGSIVFYIVSYVNAVIQFWTMSVWVITFLTLTAEEEKSVRAKDTTINAKIVENTPIIEPKNETLPEHIIDIQQTIPQKAEIQNNITAPQTFFYIPKG